jgi:predicted DNA-binding protein
MATKGKQIITNVYLDPEVYAALKRLSESTGAPMAHYLREGAKKVLEQHGIVVNKARAKR